MKEPFIKLDAENEPHPTSSFVKMYSGKNDVGMSSAMAKTIQKRVIEVGERIKDSGGERKREELLSYAAVTRALEKCIAYIDNKDPNLIKADFDIYFGYLEVELVKAQNEVDTAFKDNKF